MLILELLVLLVGLLKEMRSLRFELEMDRCLNLVARSFFGVLFIISHINPISPWFLSLEGIFSGELLDTF